MRSSRRRRIEAHDRDARGLQRQPDSPSPIRPPSSSCTRATKSTTGFTRPARPRWPTRSSRWAAPAARHRQIPGMPTEFIPFQSSRALKQTVALGSVEEWTIFNMNYDPAPFPHSRQPIPGRKHQRPADRAVLGGHDRLPPGGSPTNPTSVTFRTRFRDFKGAFVMHCHMLATRTWA